MTEALGSLAGMTENSDAAGWMTGTWGAVVGITGGVGLSEVIIVLERWRRR
jgi:hypothetical protein